MSPVASAWAHDSGADLAKTNVNGGAIAIAIAIGHERIISGSTYGNARGQLVAASIR